MCQNYVRLFGILLLGTLLVGVGCDRNTNLPNTVGVGDGSSGELTFDNFNKALALRWAPIHLQDVDTTGGGAFGHDDHSLNGRSDYITNIDFDGDWDTLNNWENAEDPNLSLLAHCYYSVVATETHWFIIYAFYHPRDWEDSFFLEEHENDLEGLLAIVKRPPVFAKNDFGELLGVITVFHTDFFSYKHKDSLLTDTNHESIDGTLEMEPFLGRMHPVTAQEAKGHGLKAHPDVKIKGGDGVKYFPSDVAQEPSNPNDRDVGYKLVHIFEPCGGMWERKNNIETFHKPDQKSGVFRGDNGKNNAAHAPWAWNDKNDASFNPSCEFCKEDELPGGELALDPVKLVKIYFGELGNFSEVYTYNGYQAITCEWPMAC